MVEEPRSQVIHVLSPTALSRPRTTSDWEPGCQSSWLSPAGKHCRPPFATSMTNGLAGDSRVCPRGMTSLTTASGRLRNDRSKLRLALNFSAGGTSSMPGPLRTSFRSCESTASIKSAASSLIRCRGRSSKPDGHFVGFDDRKTRNPYSSAASAEIERRQPTIRALASETQRARPGAQNTPGFGDGTDARFCGDAVVIADL